MKEQNEIKSYKTRILIGLFVVFIVMSIVYIPLAYRAKFGFPLIPKPLDPITPPDSSTPSDPSTPTNPTNPTTPTKPVTPSRPSKQWDIQSTIVGNGKVYGNAEEKSKPRLVGNTFYFDVLLKSPGDYVLYDIEVSNKGVLDAVLEQVSTSIDHKENTKNAIRFTVTGIEKGSSLNSGDTKKIQVKVEWDPAVQEEIEHAYSTLFVHLQFVQK